MALTDKEVRKAKPSDKAYKLCDERGLLLWVTPSGGKDILHVSCDRRGRGFSIPASRPL